MPEETAEPDDADEKAILGAIFVRERQILKYGINTEMMSDQVEVL
jgi:hypothetical protein